MARAAAVVALVMAATHQQVARAAIMARVAGVRLEVAIIQTRQGQEFRD